MNHQVLLIIFWLGLAVTAYAYVGFPLLIGVLARRGAPPHPRSDNQADQTVTIIVPAYNEEKNIGAKIENVLASDYPREHLDVLVVSDASTDRTNAIVERFSGDGVRLIVQPARCGKTAGLNRALTLARGGIIVFTDANAWYSPVIIRNLVGYFRDRRIGLVTGYTKYTIGADGTLGEATNAYTRLERAIKSAESRWGCCVGADGAIFAMRRSLYRTLRDDDINDFVLPLSVIEQGHACVFADDAFCSELPGTTLESEFRRQSRITNRTLRALWRNAHVLNPLRFPRFAFLLFSHKVMRFVVPAFLAVSGVTGVALAASGGFPLPLAAAVLGGCAIAALATLAPASTGGGGAAGKLLNACRVFVTINLAMLHGWWKFMSGRNDVTWQHDRSTSNG
jgi:cellulose synthase/poly-beta-1,6-N-acetylglucosamine synthase-like glycosyltransferase